jgi:O-antigen/teichoic acid export membrane protein
MMSLFRTGIILSIPAIFLIRLILVNYYQFEFTLDIYMISFFYVIPFYYYLVTMYQYFKHNRQKTVVFITLLATLFNLTMSVVLINRLGIKGALLAGTLSQWFMLILFVSIDKLFGKRKILKLNQPIYQQIKTETLNNPENNVRS